MNPAPLPIFVYGTLRHGLGNYSRILDGHTIHEEPATLHGAIMRDAGGCPFVTITGTGTSEVVGEIMYLDPENAPATMRRLDRLESFHGEGDPGNMYDRVRTTVTRTDGTPVEVFVYVTGSRFTDWASDMPVIASGDWKNRLRTPAPA